MFQSIKRIWDDKGFEILIVLSLIVIAVMAISRIGKKGTWSKTTIYDPYYDMVNVKKKKIRNNTTRSYDTTDLTHVKKYSKGETECRRVLEKIFNKPFKSCRPDFLRNPVTGGKHNLELDMYNAELNLSCEYNGAQHYNEIPYFHKNKETFYNQLYRDELKRRMCKDKGVVLIEVSHKVKLHEIENYLRSQLVKLGYQPYFKK